MVEDIPGVSIPLNRKICQFFRMSRLTVFLKPKNVHDRNIVASNLLRSVKDLYQRVTLTVVLEKFSRRHFEIPIVLNFLRRKALAFHAILPAMSKPTF